MPENINTLEYLIQIGLDKARATEAERELRKIGNEAVKQAQSIDSSYRVVGESITSSTRQTKDGIATVTRMTQTIQNQAGEQKTLVNAVEKTDAGIRRLDDATKVTTRSMGQMNRGMQGLIASSAKLAIRAVAVVPIWMAIRGVFTSTIGTFSDSVRSIVEVDKALQFTRNELIGFENVSQILDQVRERAKRLARETGRSVAELIETFRLFKTAGIGVEESMAGMETAIRGALATQGDAAKIGKLLADLYNLMGDRITEVSSDTDKFNLILGKIVATMPTNVINIEDYTAALKNFTAVGKSSNLTLDELVTLVAVASTLMQRGSRAGTQLARAFRQIADKRGDIELFLGKAISNDISNFDLLIQVLTEANARLKEGRDVTAQLNNIFGQRAGRVINSYVANLAKLNKEVVNLKDLDFPALMEIVNERVQNATDSITIQSDRMARLREELTKTFLFAATGTRDWADALKEVNNLLEDMKPLTSGLGQIIKTTASDPLRAVGLIGGNLSVRRKLADAVREERQAQQRLIQERAKLGLRPGLSISQVAEENQRRRGFALGELPEVKGAKEALQVEQERNFTFEERIRLAESLAALGFNELQIELRRLQILEETKGKEEEVGKQRLKIIDLLNRQIIEFSQNIQNAFDEGLQDLLLGEGDVVDLGKRFGDAIKRGLVEAISGNVTEQIFQKTGIGGFFGELFTGIRFGNSVEGRIRSGFDKGAQITKKAIIDGFTQGSILARQSVGGGQATFGGAGGAPGGGGGLFGGFGDLLNRPIFRGKQGGPATTSQGIKVPSTTTPPSGPTIGQGLAAAFGIFQGVQQIRRSQDTAGRIGGGLLATGAALSLVNPAIGLPLAIIGTIVSGFSKTKEETVDEKITQKQISSRIEISNKKLELINRNLVALRTTFETFVLPESAFFSEKRNLEDDFSIDARR